MKRLSLWLLGGLLLGGIIHILVILTLPILSEHSIWTRTDELDIDNKVVALPRVAAGEVNPLGLDPALSYGLCRLDLEQGPGYITGVLPDAYWSVALYNSAGTVVYSTTNRDGISNELELGVFTNSQTRLLAEQQLDISEGLLVVETNDNDLLVLVRLYPPHEVMRARYETALTQLSCGPKHN
jgi:uncharacterized membrane protein